MIVMEVFAPTFEIKGIKTEKSTGKRNVQVSNVNKACSKKLKRNIFISIQSNHPVLSALFTLTRPIKIQNS